MITIQVQKIQVTKDADRNKVYTPIDITNQVVMPIIDVERLDNTLDTSSLTLVNNDGEAIKPFTRIIIRLDDGETKQNIYRLVYTDQTEILTYGLTKKYKHNVELIEPTKWLERFEVDNTTITNLLTFLYEDPYEGRAVIYPYYKKTIQEYDILGGFASILFYGDGGYNKNAGYQPFYSFYKVGETIDFSKILYTPSAKLKFVWATKIRKAMKISFYRVITPSGQDVLIYGNGQWFNTQYTFTEEGKYIVEQQYEYTFGWADDPHVVREYRWEIQVLSQAPNTIQRKTLAETAQLVLQRIGDESSLLRENETQLFSIANETYEKMSKIQSPEFTFSQNTLFGILEQIGEVMHAIPRLNPNPVEFQDGTIDDWSNWNLITFDVLGGDEEAQTGETIEQEKSYNGDNYATNYTTNVENSFQTNKEDYIAITEPYGGGFISTRTESADYEVSANSACIKLSRPVQRIVQLICRVENNGDILDVDITPYVKEVTDYNLLDDYVSESTEIPSIGSKDMAIYYTRGDNVIRGLDYIRPTRFNVENLWVYQAIFNILHRATNGVFNRSWTVGWKMDDLMFRVKYVPYYGMKLKQYKNTIEADSGNNELFFNQQNSQMVDIAAYGENVKGALLRTANQEISRTEYFSALADVVKIGQKRNEYYAYQVNKEITNYRVKTTTEYSKNWNKWNEYVAIKKNYRQWEISEKESVNTNPVKNEFLIAGLTSNTVKRGLNRVITSWTPVPEYTLIEPTPTDAEDYNDKYVYNETTEEYEECTYIGGTLTPAWVVPGETEAYDKVILPDTNRFWGWMIRDTLPTDEEVTAFAEQHFEEEFEQLETDDLVVVQVGETTYKYYYTYDWDTSTGFWTHYEAVPNYTEGNYVGALDIRSSATRDPGVSTTTVPKSWKMDDYYYEIATPKTGRRIYKTATGVDFQTIEQLEEATTFYHNGEEVTLQTGDYAIIYIGIGALGYQRYVRQYDASQSDDDIWVLEYTTVIGTGSNYPTTRTYDPILTAFVKKAKGSVEEGDLVFAAVYTLIEPTFDIYKYEDNQWVDIKSVSLRKTSEEGYGLGSFEYIMSEYNEDGFASIEAMHQVRMRLADTTRSESNYFPIDWAVVTTKSSEYDMTELEYKDVEFTFIVPCACFAFGNSVVVNFQTNDNYSAGTFINREDFQTGTTYSIEDYVRYSDKYGNFNSFSLVFGSGYAKDEAFNTIASSKTNSKKLYKFDKNEVNENRVVLDYRDNAFQLVKDSRQQISYTGQLHFVSDTPNATFGSAFAEAMPFVGNRRTEAGTVKFVGFYSKPNKFLSNKATDYEQIENKVAYNYFTKEIKLTFDNTTEGDFIGVGLIDNNDNIMLYFEKEVGAGESTDLFLEFRHDI